MKKIMMSIIASIAIFSFGFQSFAATCPPHAWYIYESNMVHSTSRQCLEDPNCTVTKYYYQVRYRCSNCGTFKVESQESPDYHSVHHPTN